MVQLAPVALGDMGKRILGNLSKYILDKPKTREEENEMITTSTSSFFDGHFTFLPDEPHSDPEIGADTRVKVSVNVVFQPVSLLFRLARTGEISHTSSVRST